MAMFSYNLSVWCDISEKNMVIVVIGGTVIRYHMLLMLITYHLALCQIWVIMATFSYSLCICCYISENNGLILFVFGTVIRYQVLLTHVKYNLALYHIWVRGQSFSVEGVPKKGLNALMILWPAANVLRDFATPPPQFSDPPRYYGITLFLWSAPPPPALKKTCLLFNTVYRRCVAEGLSFIGCHCKFSISKRQECPYSTIKHAVLS